MLAGQVDPLTTGMMLCEVICAAQALSMPELAREWTDLMEHWRGGAAFGGIHGRCRVHRAELLRITGPCDAAEAEALTACAELRPWMRREYGWPLVELGMIRLRKGDLAGAEDAFVVAERIAWSAARHLAAAPDPGRRSHRRGAHRGRHRASGRHSVEGATAVRRPARRTLARRPVGDRRSACGSPDMRERRA